ncbi:hypothetical protein M406DRAFT_349996 [Cryphonectria parasitica EP155]|uniref:Uncharacterized protein n=1 Tax=Cryphonectria parasitica (strain ATCC 38755 / EP155) TaxID=660469 RepID=A0A9P4Y915_CRYP1|nr:uncharacterized protein M406DRAFT_349996 [Cryphonectria parasitica EP155]KAF3768991.1 hypothetical protein M406DRAFT_349996 [Cryphonectria parasitica EP155]
MDSVIDEIDRIIGELDSTTNSILLSRNAFSSGSLPTYLGPPTADDYNESISENHEPALTLSTTDVSSWDSGLHQHGSDATQPKTNFKALRAPQVDLQYIGEAPEIFVEGPPARPPDLTQEADLPGGTAARHGHRVSRPANPSVDVSLPMLSALGGASAVGNTADIPLSATPMTRDGSKRSGRICDRGRMAELLPGEGQPSVWQADLAETMLPVDNCPTSNAPIYISVGFEPDPGDSSDLTLSLQSSLGTSSFSPASWSFEQYYRPPSTIFPAVPLTTAGNWPGILPSARSLQAAAPFGTQPLWMGGSWPGGYSSPELYYRLCPHELPSANALLAWAEKQVRQELARHSTFEAAIGTLIFTLLDRPLSVPPPPERAGRNKNKPTPLSSRVLLRNVCDMMSWLQILRAQTLYVRQWPSLGPYGSAGGAASSSYLMEGVLSELKWLAVAELVAAERSAVENLDLLLNKGIKGVEVQVLACLWQMILIYRQQIAVFTTLASMHAAIRITVEPALAILYQLQRTLLVKYGACFRSSSPFYPRRGQPSTTDRLQGDARLKGAWQNVLTSRQDFDREISASMAPSDVLLKVLVTEVENDLRRRRLQKRAPARRPPPAS